MDEHDTIRWLDRGDSVAESKETEELPSVVLTRRDEFMQSLVCVDVTAQFTVIQFILCLPTIRNNTTVKPQTTHTVQSSVKNCVFILSTETGMHWLFLCPLPNKNCIQKFAKKTLDPNPERI